MDFHSYVPWTEVHKEKRDVEIVKGGGEPPPRAQCDPSFLAEYCPLPPKSPIPSLRYLNICDTLILQTPHGAR